MLVLSRRTGEAIVIDGGIKLTVVGISRGRVKIGIDAPDGIAVDRKEIRDAKIQQGKIKPIQAGPVSG
jgi:carbon storage regulator